MCVCFERERECVCACVCVEVKGFMKDNISKVREKGIAWKTFQISQVMCVCVREHVCVCM